jgi:16S rRNA processing protein RimM
MGKTEAPRYLVVGHLNKAHGTKGEIFVWPLTDHPESSFAPGVVLYLGDENGELPTDHPTDPPTLRIDASRAYRRGFLVRFEGRHDRRTLEGLLGRYVMRGMEQLEDLAEGETFYHDLLGMEVVTVEGERVGEVIEIYELNPVDLLEIRGPEKDFMIPYIAEMIHSVSVADNRIVLDPPPGLLEV